MHSCIFHQMNSELENIAWEAKKYVDYCNRRWLVSQKKKNKYRETIKRKKLRRKAIFFFVRETMGRNGIQ